MTGLALACDNAGESLESATEGVPPAGPAAGYHPCSRILST